MKNNIKKIEFIYETFWTKKEMVAIYNSNELSEEYVNNHIKLYPDLGYDSCRIIIIPKVTFNNVFRGMI